MTERMKAALVHMYWFHGHGNQQWKEVFGKHHPIARHLVKRGCAESMKGGDNIRGLGPRRYTVYRLTKEGVELARKMTADAQQPTPQGETTAADSWPDAFDDPAIDPVPLEEREGT